MRKKEIKNKKDLFFVDYPIESKKEDLLNRANLAENIAKIILGFKSKESYVIGIEGKWGSGKTSFIESIHFLVEIDKTPDFILRPYLN